MAVKVGLKYIDIWGESMEDRILEYEKEPIVKDQIVFYGPSYFTRWSTRFGMKPMREVLLGKSGAECVINRGFGSSCAEHQLYYYSRMIRPLEPRVLVYHCIANGSAFGYSVEESWEIGQRVVAWAETDFPGIQIYLCGISPLKRERNVSELASCERVKGYMTQFASERENRHYIDVLSYEPIASRKDIFVEDGVHFNQEGYDIYAELFKEALKAELDKY